MKHPVSLLIASLMLAQPVIASTSSNRLDSLVGTWKNPRAGAESVTVVIRKNLVGELLVQGDDSASSYTLSCRRESGHIACAGSGKMRADGQAFIYRNTIKPVGDKLVENWRVNLASSPDGPPANSGNDELVREANSGRGKEARGQKPARGDSTVAPRVEAVRPPPRPNLPLEISEDVWKALEASEAYLNQPRQQALRTRNSYESQVVYTGAKNTALKPRPPKVETRSSEVTPIGDRCHKKHQTSPYFAMETYSCGSVILGSIHNGKPWSVIKSIDQLQGSLFPMRIGARMSYRAQSVTLADSKYDSTTTLSCEVVSKGSAQELDSRLTGAAWKIRCQGNSTMPQNDSKVIDFSSDDYYFEEMGARLSEIGVHNMLTKEHVLAKPGTQTVLVAEGDYGSRTTHTYQYHHFAVGESQIAADATEWGRQNAEENRLLAENERRRAEMQQATQAREKAAREQQAAQAQRPQPASVAPAQTAQSAQSEGGGLLGAVVGDVIKSGLGQAASRNRASGTAGGQIAGQFYDQAAAKIGNSSSMADTGGNSASVAGGAGGGVPGGGCCSSVSERIADNRARGAPDDFETHLEMNCRKVMKFDMRINYCQEAVNDRRLNRDGLAKYPHPGTNRSGGSEEARNREIAKQCIASSKQNTNQPQIDTLCSQAANYMCLYGHFKDQAPQLKPQAMQICQSLKTTYGDVCKGPCSEAAK